MCYVMCSTYCVCMFLCLLYAPIHQNKFQVGVNLLGNKYYSDSDSDHCFVAAGFLEHFKDLHCCFPEFDIKCNDRALLNFQWSMVKLQMHMQQWSQKRM